MSRVLVSRVDGAGAYYATCLRSFLEPDSSSSGLEGMTRERNRKFPPYLAGRAAGAVLVM